MPRETLRPASLRLWSGPRGIPIHHIQTHTTHTYSRRRTGRWWGASNTKAGAKHSLGRARAHSHAFARCHSLWLRLFRSFKVPSIVTPVVTSFHSDSPTIFLLFEESQVPVSVNGTLPRSFVISALTYSQSETRNLANKKHRILDS